MGTSSRRLTITYHQVGSTAWRTSVGDGYGSVWVWLCQTPDDLVPERLGGAARGEHVAGIDRVRAGRRVGVAARPRLADHTRRRAVGTERSEEQAARLVGEAVVAVADDRRVLRPGDPQGRGGELRHMAP